MVSDFRGTPYYHVRPMCIVPFHRVLCLEDNALSAEWNGNVFKLIGGPKTLNCVKETRVFLKRGSSWHHYSGHPSQITYYLHLYAKMGILCLFCFQEKKKSVETSNVKCHNNSWNSRILLTFMRAGKLVQNSNSRGGYKSFLTGVAS